MIALVAIEFSKTLATGNGALWLIGPGVIEGAIVGTSQWLVLRHRMPDIRAWSWILATMVGALVAWILGSVPGALMDADTQPAAPETMGRPALIALYAAALGLVAGVILAAVQWWVLRGRTVRSAILWLPANACAWAIAMPIIFAAAESVPQPAPMGRLALTIFAATGLADLVVGAIHGAALVWMTRPVRQAPVALPR